MPNVYMQRTLAGLAPWSDKDREVIAALPMGKMLSVTIAQKRNANRHRYYWALLGTIVDNQTHYKTTQQLHIWLKLRMGVIEEIIAHDGVIHIIPGSTAFDKMTEPEFAKFLTAAIDVLTTEVIPGLDRAELVSEINRETGLQPKRKAA